MPATQPSGLVTFNSIARVLTLRYLLEPGSKKLNEIEGIEARLFVGQTKKGDTGMSQKQQKEMQFLS